MNAGKKIFKNSAVFVAFLSFYVCSAVSSHAAPVSISPFSNTISDNELDQDRGAGITNVASSSASAVITGGSTIGNSGENLISGGAFTNASGLITVGEITGNNDVFQSNTTLNVTFVGAGSSAR